MYLQNSTRYSMNNGLLGQAFNFKTPEGGLAGGVIGHTAVSAEQGGLICVARKCNARKTSLNDLLGPFSLSFTVMFRPFFLYFL